MPCRQLDVVAVKGKTQGVKIFTPRKVLSKADAQAWKLHGEGLRHYYARDFAGALRCFSEIQKIHPRDETSKVFVERSRTYLKSPPPEDWKGVEQILEK